VVKWEIFTTLIFLQNIGYRRWLVPLYLLSSGTGLDELFWNRYKDLLNVYSGTSFVLKFLDKPFPLNSAFHLTYKMMLNLLRVEWMKCAQIIVTRKGSYSLSVWMHLTVHCVTCEYGTNLKFGHLTLLKLFYSDSNFTSIGWTHWVVTNWSWKSKKAKDPFSQIWSQLCTVKKLKGMKLKPMYVKHKGWAVHCLATKSFLYFYRHKSQPVNLCNCWVTYFQVMVPGSIHLHLAKLHWLTVLF